MAAELDRADARTVVTERHAAFVGLGRRFTEACTVWVQLHEDLLASLRLARGPDT